MLTFSVQIGDFLCVSRVTQLQSLPIHMRATIQYLANLWMDFKILFTKKHIFMFCEGLITNMSLDITIYSTLLINLFILLNLPFYFCIELRVAAEPQESWKGSMGEKSYPS